MKITFLVPKASRDIKNKRSTTFQSKSGYGSSILGGLLEGGGGKARRLKNKVIQLEVKRKPSLTEKEIKLKNDQEWQKLNAWDIELQTLSNEMDGKPAVEKIMLLMYKDFKKEMAAFKSCYNTVYKSEPPAQYKESELTTIYVGFVIEKGVAEPSQLQLKEFSKISQSTWSRAFQSLTFWKEVNSKIENIWNAKDAVTKNIDLVVRKRIDNKEFKEDDLTPVQLNLKELANSVDERDSIALNLDSERFRTWDKPKLMKAIIKLRYDAKLAELEKCTEEQLRRILAILR
jgi:hypothetical protein